MSDKRLISIFLSLAVVLTGCVETIVMDPGEEDLPVVVNCILDFQDGGYTLKPSGGRGLSLTLQYAKGKKDPEFIPVEDAVVYLERPAETLPGLNRIDFVHTEGCTWESDESLLRTHIYPNERYILHIEIPGREPIWAETWTLPDIGFHMSFPEDDFIMSLQFDGYNENCRLWAFGVERSTEGWFWNGKLADYLVTDHPYVDPLNLEGLHYSDLTFQGTTTDYYGLTASKVFELAKVRLAEMPLYEGFIHIDDLSYDKPFFFFPGPLTTDYPRGDFDISDGMYTIIYVVDQDMDKYLRSVYVHNKSLDANLASVYSTSNDIYTNIHGGLGIFGSRYEFHFACIYPLYMAQRDWTE